MKNKKVHFHCIGDYAICSDYVIGTPKAPALDSRGKKKCEFKASWGSTELKVLDDICQFCYSETVCTKFKEFVGGRISFTPYNMLRQAFYDAVSSDGGSVIPSRSFDSDSSDALSS